jgi:alkylation response protein AidB-like acyl-CoA dehydrogenase
LLKCIASRSVFLINNSNHLFSLPNDFFEPIAANAAGIDQEGLYPEADFKWLAEKGLLQIGLPGQLIDFENPDTAALLQLLKQIGGANLAVGRIYEGHVNALQLVHLYATKLQREKWFNDATENKVFGVWNTQDSEGIKIHGIGNNQYRLEGCKTFCSGAGLVQRPLITGELLSPDKKGWQMCIIPVEKVMDIPVDKSFWKPLGMRASASFRLNFTDIIITEEELLGPPNAYYRQPHFSGGAIRFAAVQLGGAEAILKETTTYLMKLGRTDDPFQKARLAEITYLVETGNLWLESAGQKADAWKGEEMAAKIVAYANMMRTVVEEICLRTMQLAERCMGARGLLQPGPLERIHRDLTLYLRQPAPDASLTDIASYVFNQNGLPDGWK